MVTQFLSTALRGGRTAIISLALISTMLPAAPNQVSPALADPAATAAAADDTQDPDARLQITIRSIKIIDDNDWGEGDMNFHVYVWRVKPGCEDDATSADCTTALVDSAPIKFGANDGDVKPIGRDIPDPNPGAKVYEPSIGYEIGIPVFNDQRYGMAVVGAEEDPIIDDDMGTLQVSLTAANNWNIGTTEEKPAFGTDAGGCHIYPPGCGFVAKAKDTFVGDYSVVYEIEKIALPDLVPSFYQIDGDNGQKFYCARVTNSGQAPSASFRLTAAFNQTVLRSVDMGDLAVGANSSHCVIRSELPTAPSSLSFRVDESRQIPEMDEHNNMIQMAIGAAPQPDLVASAIRVNGKDVTPQLLCKAGKNDITVTARNQGAASAAATTVQFIEDDLPASMIEQPLGALDAGSILDVAFPDVQLKKGTHTLTAIVDGKKTITESKDDNNQLTVTVKCKDDDD